MELEEFANKYKTASADGLDSLYRFSSYSTSKKQHHKKLLTDGWLFHNLPQQFNDPFECKPQFKWPDMNPKEVEGFKEDILFLQNIIPRENRKEVTLDDLLKDNELRERLEKGVSSIYSQFRLCCFTKCNNNLLFWSHYADSHKGYCMRFNAKGTVISNARKVHYSVEYPSFSFPIFSDMLKTLEPVLNKSTDWDKEDEYRSIFAPFGEGQLANDGECLSLEVDEITDIYFGASMEERYKNEIIELVKKGKFKPRFWNTVLSSREFKLEFHPFS